MNVLLVHLESTGALWCQQHVDASEAKLQFSVVCGLREIVKVDEIYLKTGKTWVHIHAQTFLSAVQSSILIAYSVPKFDMYRLLVWLAFWSMGSGCINCVCLHLRVRFWRVIRMSLQGAIPSEVLVNKCLVLESAETSSEIGTSMLSLLAAHPCYFI